MDLSVVEADSRQLNKDDCFFNCTYGSPLSESVLVKGQFEKGCFGISTSSCISVNGTGAFAPNIVDVDLAVDGDRDGDIDFDNDEDKKYLFWVNNDRDSLIRNSLEERTLGDVEWIEDDEQGASDADDDFIGRSAREGESSCRRDLEDFSRLHIQKIPSYLLDDNDVSFYLQFKNITFIGENLPEINIFKAVDDSLRYLEFATEGDSQILESKIATVSTEEIELEKNYLSSTETTCFIFEGKEDGKGYLTLIVKRNDVSICEKSINIELRDIKTFYRHWKVGGTGDEIPEVADEQNASNYEYQPEEDKFVLYIHGWNMSGQWVKEVWTETMFKRLWW
ncbi:MAG: hypothetical protein HQL32_16505, partial [Planctomycetes bacterium]|nr:hypothetical protein [Planctomycetota bacterium]